MRSLGRSLVALVAVGLLFAGPQGLAADGPDASQEPRTSGPLVGIPSPCPDNGPAGPKEARGQSCSWTYQLLPAETNATEDFSAYWIQFEIDPGRQWCAKVIDFRLKLSADGPKIVSAVPDRGGRVTKAEPMVTSLIVDGGGTAPVPGVIEQDVVTPVGRTKVSVNERTYSYRWVGNSRDKIMIALGIQLAHQTVPPQFSYSWSESGGFGMGTCRMIVIRMRE